MNIETTDTNKINGSSAVSTQLLELHPESLRYKAVSEHLLSELNGEAVILSLKNGKYYGLNAVGSRIWELLQKKIAVKEIENVILNEYSVDHATGEREVSSFLNRMIAEELVEIVNEKGF